MSDVLTASARSSDSTRRALILAILFAAAAALVFAFTALQVEGAPRFPEESGVFAVDGWKVGALTVSGRPGVQFVNRDYLRADGAQARLSLTTSPQAKLVYRAGADVPFLGSGYTIEDAPAELVAPSPNRTAQIARRGNETWLQIAAYGERRGALGNGPLAWGLAVGDLLIGHANDYYLARILVPYATASDAKTAVELADTLLPRIVAWYGRSA